MGYYRDSEDNKFVVTGAISLAVMGTTLIFLHSLASDLKAGSRRDPPSMSRALTQERVAGGFLSASADVGHDNVEARIQRWWSQQSQPQGYRAPESSPRR